MKKTQTIRRDATSSLIPTKSMFFCAMPLTTLAAALLLILSSPVRADGGQGGNGPTGTIGGQGGTTGSPGVSGGAGSGGGGGGGGGGFAGGVGVGGGGAGGIGGSNGYSGLGTGLQGNVTGGNGANGVLGSIVVCGPNLCGAGGGGGGEGGTGAVLSSSVNLAVGQIVRGGIGGVGGFGGAGSATSGNGGNGGGGGTGMILNGYSSIFNNSGNIIGGLGAAGGGGGAVGRGGNGGVALITNGDSVTISNSGSLTGGNGSGSNGLGGTGADLKGNNGTFINNGTVVGGLDTTGTLQANAMQITGNDNTLELQIGSNFIGNVVSSGSGNKLALGGVSNSLFNVNQVGTTALYQGFSLFEKTGISTWVLSGINVGLTSWTIRQGILSISEDASLGNSTSLLTLNGGTLQLSDDMTLGRVIALGSTPNSTIDTQDYADTLTGTIVDANTGQAGALTKAGSGILTLTGDNTYTGLTTIAAGTLQVGDGSTTGSLTSNIVNQSALIFNRSDDSSYTGVLSGNGSFNKKGSGMLTLNSVGANQGNVSVDQGTLRFLQSGDFTTSGNYTTQNGATTNIGQLNSALHIGGVFTQEATSILNITLGSPPDITAQSAVLNGTLVVSGFSDGPAPIKASEAVNNQYTMIHTTGGITGDFVNNPLSPIDLDYLLHEGSISTNGMDYRLGFTLAWDQGDVAQGVGSFTLSSNTAFDVDIELTNQVIPAGNFVSGWDGKSLTKNGEGLLILSAVNTYTGVTTLNEGTLKTRIINAFADSSQVVVNGGTLDLNGNNQLANALSGIGGEILLNGAILTVNNTNTTDNSTFAGAITDGSTEGGSLIKTGTGTLTLTGDLSYTGNTLLNAGQLVLDGSANGARLISNIVGETGSQLSLINGASLTGWIDPTSVALDYTSRWNMTANSQINDLSNNGLVNFVTPIANDFNTLTVLGNYSGNNGSLMLNTRLGADNSATDKLVVNGNTSGMTSVRVNNVGGTGAQTIEGIELIAVNGSSDGVFTQSGRIVAGAYDYTLARGLTAEKSNNWYLTSKSTAENYTIRPEAGSYTANLAAANTMFGTSLHDRLGEAQYIDALTGERRVTSLWLRNEGGHNRTSDNSGQLRTLSNRYVMQLGGDMAQWSNNGLDRGHLGLMAGYGNNKSTTRSSGVAGYDAKGSVDGYSTGIYSTWYANDADKSGLYMDSWVQYSWFNNTVDGHELAIEEYKSKGVTASVESGYTVKIGENAAKNTTYFIQPNAQVTWMGVKADDHKEANSTDVSGEGNGNIQSRLGVKVFMNGYSYKDKGKDRVFQPFIEVDWIHNTKDFSSVMNGLEVTQAGAKNLAELKLGVEGQISSKLNLWGNISQQLGDKGYSDTAALVGVKYNF